MHTHNHTHPHAHTGHTRATATARGRECAAIRRRGGAGARPQPHTQTHTGPSGIGPARPSRGRRGGHRRRPAALWDCRRLLARELAARGRGPGLTRPFDARSAAPAVIFSSGSPLRRRWPATPTVGRDRHIRTHTHRHNSRPSPSRCHGQARTLAAAAARAPRAAAGGDAELDRLGAQTAGESPPLRRSRIAIRGGAASVAGGRARPPGPPGAQNQEDGASVPASVTVRLDPAGPVPA